MSSTIKDSIEGVGVELEEVIIVDIGVGTCR